MNFLGSIKDALGMDSEKCEALVRDQQIGLVSNQVEEMFEKASVTAGDVRKMRDTADLYDIDLKKDLDLPKIKLERMFLTEVEDLVDSGELQGDDMSPLEELCEPLHVSEERAQAILEQTVQKRVNAGLLEAAADLRGGGTKRAVEGLAEMLKFASLLPGVEADSKVPPSECSELLMLYQASGAASGGSVDVSDERIDLLKSVMKIKNGAPSAA